MQLLSQLGLLAACVCVCHVWHSLGGRNACEVALCFKFCQVDRLYCCLLLSIVRSTGLPRIGGQSACICEGPLRFSQVASIACSGLQGPPGPIARSAVGDLKWGIPHAQQCITREWGFHVAFHMLSNALLCVFALGRLIVLHGACQLISMACYVQWLRSLGQHCCICCLLPCGLSVCQL